MSIFDRFPTFSVLAWTLTVLVGRSVLCEERPRSPFRPPVATPTATHPADSRDLRDYQVEELRLTATFTTFSGDRMASVENRQGIGFFIKVGSQIGPDKVKVVAITPRGVVLHREVDTTLVVMQLSLNANE